MKAINDYLDVTETVTKIPVKKLKWNKTSSVFIGFVKCPLYGKPDFNDGFITNSWRINGKSYKIRNKDYDVVIPDGVVVDKIYENKI